jgi:hypothetical protein
MLKGGIISKTKFIKRLQQKIAAGHSSSKIRMAFNLPCKGILHSFCFLANDDGLLIKILNLNLNYFYICNDKKEKS